MNKVKMIFTALGVIGIVGGALALNLKTYGSFVYCGTVPGAVAGGPQCPGLFDTGYFPSPNGNRWCSAIAGAACTTRAFIIANVE